MKKKNPRVEELVRKLRAEHPDWSDEFARRVAIKAVGLAGINTKKRFRPKAPKLGNAVHFWRGRSG